MDSDHDKMENGQEKACEEHGHNPNNDGVGTDAAGSMSDFSTPLHSLAIAAPIKSNFDSYSVDTAEAPYTATSASQRVISIVELAERNLYHLPQIDLYRARILSRDILATISISRILLLNVFVLHKLPTREDPDELLTSRQSSYAVDPSSIKFQFSLPVPLSIPARGAMNTTLANPFVFEPLDTVHPVSPLILRKKFEDHLFGNADLDSDIHSSNIDCQYVTDLAVWQLYFSVGRKNTEEPCSSEDGEDERTAADDGFQWVNKVVRRERGVRIMDLKLAIEKALCSKMGEHYGAGLGIEGTIDILAA